MMERTKMRMLPLASRANDLAPAASVCCNACRTCVTTNLFALAFGAAGGLVLGVRRFARRFVRA
jgi:hypothetical protein